MRRRTGRRALCEAAEPAQASARANAPTSTVVDNAVRSIHSTLGFRARSLNRGFTLGARFLPLLVGVLHPNVRGSRANLPTLRGPSDFRRNDGWNIAMMTKEHPGRSLSRDRDAPRSLRRRSFVSARKPVSRRETGAAGSCAFGRISRPRHSQSSCRRQAA